MPDNNNQHPKKMQPSSPRLERIRKLLLIIASSRKRWRREWQARADWLTARAIERSWMGRLAAHHRKQRSTKDLKDWRDQWQRNAAGVPLSNAVNAAIALREHPQLSGRLILVDGQLTALDRAGRRRLLTHEEDLEPITEFLTGLGLADLTEQDCLRALAVVAAENGRETNNGR